MLGYDARSFRMDLESVRYAAREDLVLAFHEGTVFDARSIHMDL